MASKINVRINVRINVKSKALLYFWALCVKMKLPVRFTRFLAGLAVEYKVGPQ